MTDSNEFAIKFNQIITKGRKDNTYKFALARFLLDHCNKLEKQDILNKIRNNESELVDYQDIANAFLFYYWHQECKYRIRQNYNDAKPPSVVTIIRDIFGNEYIPTPFKDVPTEKIKKAQVEIRKKCLARKKTRHLK